MTKRLLAIVLLFASALPGTGRSNPPRRAVRGRRTGRSRRPDDRIRVAGAAQCRRDRRESRRCRRHAWDRTGGEISGRPHTAASKPRFACAECRIHAQPGYDPIKSFTPIVFVGLVPSVLVVNAQSGISSFAELLVTARRGTLSYGSAGPGSSTHIAGAIFTAMAGTDHPHTVSRCRTGVERSLGRPPRSDRRRYARAVATDRHPHGAPARAVRR